MIEHIKESRTNGAVFTTDRVMWYFAGQISRICTALAEARHEAVAEVIRQQPEFNRSLEEWRHSIRNNLEVIIGCLTEELRDIAPDVRAMLNATMEKVRGGAAGQDFLPPPSTTSNVDFDAFLRSLCRSVPQRSEIAIEVEAQHVGIPLNRAVPAGLIVNELVSNSVKYAFGNSGGRIWVNFGLIGPPSEACVAVQDDGKGMDLPPNKGFGLTVIERLAQQIQGRIRHVPVKPGTRTVLCFPVRH